MLICSLAHAQDVAPALKARAGDDVERVEMVDDHIYRGASVLTPRDFFGLVGRTDLVQRSESNLVRRRWLVGSAIAVAVVGVALGVVLLALTPNGNAPYCVSTVERSQQCDEQIGLYNRGGIISISSGLVLGGVLAALGILSNPDVLSPKELTPMVDAYNHL
jgi:hypothetical protein